MSAKKKACVTNMLLEKSYLSYKQDSFKKNECNQIIKYNFKNNIVHLLIIIKNNIASHFYIYKVS